MPIQNARIADFGRRAPSICDHLPGCAPRPQHAPTPSPGFSLSVVDAEKDKILLRIHHLASGSIDKSSISAVVRSLQRVSGDSQTVDIPHLAHELEKVCFKDRTLLRQFCSLVAGGDVERDGQATRVNIRTVEQELMWLARPFSDEKYQSVSKSKDNGGLSSTLLPIRPRALQIRHSRSAEATAQRPVSNVWLQVENGRCLDEKEDEAVLASNLCGSVSRSVVLKSAVLKSVNAEDEDGVMQLDEVLERKVHLVAKAVGSRRQKADALEQALYDLVPAVVDVASMVTPSQHRTDAIWKIREGHKQAPEVSTLVSESSVKAAAAALHSTISHTQADGGTEDIPQTSTADNRSKHVEHRSSLAEQEVGLDDPISLEVERIVSARSVESSAFKMLQGSSSHGSVLDAALAVPKRSVEGRFLGDSVCGLDSDGVQTLRSLVGEDDGAAKTVFELRAWAFRWMEDLLDVSMEAAQRDGSDWHSFFLRGLRDLEDWDSDVESSEAEDAEEERQIQLKAKRGRMDMFCTTKVSRASACDC